MTRIIREALARDQQALQILGIARLAGRTVRCAVTRRCVTITNACSVAESSPRQR